MALFGSGKNQRPSAQYEQKRSNSRQQERYQNEREMREQRVKSRNRLIGSVILVLAAIIILPLILKTGEDNSQSVTTSAPLIAPDSSSSIGQSSLVVESSPGVETPSDSEVLEEFEELSESTDEGLSIAEGGLLPGEEAESPLAVDDALSEGEQEATDDASDVSIAESTAAQSDVQAAEARERAEQEAAAARERARQEQARAEAARAEQQRRQQEQAAPSSNRTDDGSQALAILEGRANQPTASAPAPAAPAASSSGEFSLQVASYTSSADARTQRDRLRSSGVSNAYIQSATVNGNQVFRLRVGPFSTREAAQAAQTRLRALNFSDSYVTGR